MPLVQRVERGETPLLCSHPLYHIASSSFRSWYMVIAQSEATQTQQLDFIVVSNLVVIFFRINSWYKICLIESWLFAKHKSQPPSITQGYVAKTHIALTVFGVLAGGTSSPEPFLPSPFIPPLFSTFVCIPPVSASLLNYLLFFHNRRG